MRKARATNHAGKGMSKHNFREFPKETKEKGKSDINRDLSYQNCYLVNGKFFESDTELKKYFSKQTDLFRKQAFRFRDNEQYKNLTTSQKYELACYEKLLGESIKAQHNRNRQRRQECLNRDALDILQAAKTQPEESILQIGNKDYCPVSAEQLWSIYKDYIRLHNAKFGEHIRILDATLHADETTPHIHERKVFIGKNRYNEAIISKNSALELLRIERPNLNKPNSRYNNRKQVYSAVCRDMWIQCCQQHGLNIETEANVYQDKHGLELTEYKIKQEQEKLNIIRQEIAEQKTEQARNDRTIIEQENMIEDYKNSRRDVDIAVYVSASLKDEYPDYYGEIVANYWEEQKRDVGNLEL